MGLKWSQDSASLQYDEESILKDTKTINRKGSWTYIAIHVRKRVKHVESVHVDDSRIYGKLRAVLENFG